MPMLKSCECPTQKFRKLNSILHICNCSHDFSRDCSWNFATVQHYAILNVNADKLWMSDPKVQRLNSILHICNCGYNFSRDCSWDFATVQHYAILNVNIEYFWMSDTACEASPCKLLDLTWPVLLNGARWCPGMPTSWDYCNVLNFTTMVITWFPMFMLKIFECLMLWWVFGWSFRCSPAPGCGTHRLWAIFQRFLCFPLFLLETIGHTALNTCIKLLAIGTTSISPTFDRSAAKKGTFALRTPLAWFLIFPSKKLNDDGLYKPFIVRVPLIQIVAWFDPESRPPQFCLCDVVPQSLAEVVPYLVVRCKHFPLYNCQPLSSTNVRKILTVTLGAAVTLMSPSSSGGARIHGLKTRPCAIVWFLGRCWKKRQFMQFGNKD